MMEGARVCNTKTCKASPDGLGGGAEISCVAAVIVKPRARLCEPWVNHAGGVEPRRGDSDHRVFAHSSPLRGSPKPTNHHPRLTKLFSIMTSLTLSYHDMVDSSKG
jgi:hypothetical protein